MRFKILSETSIRMSDLKEHLTAIKARDNELSFRAQKTVDYLESIGTLNGKDVKELFNKLTKLDVPRLKENHLNKLVDILPTTQKDVKTVLQGCTVTVTNDNLKKIADTIAEYTNKK